MVTGRPRRRSRRFKHKLPIALKVLRPHYRSLRKHDKSRYIVNLSSKSLSPCQVSALERGLNYIPSSTRVPGFEPGLARLTRTYRLDHFFGNVPDDPPPPPDPFRQQSAWQPPRAPPHVEDYLDALPDKLGGIPLKQFVPNLSKAERTAINQLIRDHSLVIRGADKGSCVVVEDLATYIADGNTHLSDRSIYAPVPKDPTLELAKGINQYVSQMKRRGQISGKMEKFLLFEKPEEVRTQQLYFLKKLHKGPHSVRPIVSGSGCPTEKLSAFIDNWLKPLVQDICHPTSSSPRWTSLPFTPAFRIRRAYRPVSTPSTVAAVAAPLSRRLPLGKSSIPSSPARQ